MKITETFADTGETIEKELEGAELAELKKFQDDYAAKKTAEAEELAEKEAAKTALLNRLGITADEAKLLLS